MADELRMALAEVLRKAGVQEADFLREGVRVLAQELMELELAEHVSSVTAITGSSLSCAGGHRVPVAAQQVAHGRARSDTR
jgi:hypothetical protein